MEIITEKKFDNQSTAEDFVLRRLHEKYDKNFVIDSQASRTLETYPLSTVYFCTAYCEEDADTKKRCTVWVTDLGSEMDDFAQHYVGEKILAEFDAILNSVEGLDGFATAFVATRTSAAVSPDVTPEAYLLKYRTAYAVCNVEFSPGLDRHRQAERIFNVIDRLLRETKKPFELRVTADGIDIFLYQFKNGFSHWTVEELDREIQNNLR
jgi:hypothetical protein